MFPSTTNAAFKTEYLPFETPAYLNRRISGVSLPNLDRACVLNTTNAAILIGRRFKREFIPGIG